MPAVAPALEVRDPSSVLPAWLYPRFAAAATCSFTKCCKEVCPEHKMPDDSIIQLKERVADRSFDPLRALLSRLIGTEEV